MRILGMVMTFRKKIVPRRDSSVQGIFHNCVFPMKNNNIKPEILPFSAYRFSIIISWLGHFCNSHFQATGNKYRKSDALDLIFRGNLAEHVQATRNNYSKTYASDPIFGIVFRVAFTCLHDLFFPYNSVDDCTSV